MAKTILEATGAQIAKIAVWDQKDTYPTISAGGKTTAAVAAETGDDIGSLNGNWIRIRDFVNQLRADIVALGTVVWANQTTAGTVNTIAQYFAGFKNFRNGVGFGEQSVADGMAQWYSASHAHVLQVNAPTITENVTITLPAVTSTLATAASVTAKQDTLTTSSNVSVAIASATSINLLKSDRSCGTLFTPLATANRTLYVPDKNGDMVLVAHGSAIDGDGIAVDSNGVLSADCDGTTVKIVGGKITAPGAFTIPLPFSTTPNNTPECPIPPGKITNILVLMASGAKESKDYSSASASIRKIELRCDAAGIVRILVDGTDITGMSVDNGAALYALITMTA